MTARWPLLDDPEPVATRIGRYELRSRIAQGGMAEVFLAVQRGPGGFEKAVAIKQLLPEMEDDPELVLLFLNEARLAATLSHPNICQIYDLGLEGGRHYIAMEYLSGQSLARLWKRGIKEQRPLSPALAAFVVARAADGLAHAHERLDANGKPLAIVHRDVSPQNIVVTYDGQVKVVDFGIARAADRVLKTKTGTVRGKLPYMSPEQLQRQPLDARSDVWALGIVLHELVTGNMLFAGEDDLATLQNVMAARIPRLAGRPGLPAGLADAVDGALQRERDRRIPSARAMAQALDAALRKERNPPGVAELAAYVQSLFPDEQRDEAERLRTAAVLEENLPSVGLAETDPEAADGTRRLAAPAPPPIRRWPWALGSAVAVAGLGSGAWLAVALRRATPAAAPAPPHVEAPAVVATAPPPPPSVAPAPASAPAVVALEPAHPKPAPHPLRAHKPPPPETPPAPAGVGTLTFDTVPWTDVYLGEQKLGTTPLVNVSLPSGHHSLRLVNSESQVDQKVDVDIRAGEKLTLPRKRL